MKNKLIIWLIVLLLTLNLVLALGIRPAKTTVISEESLQSKEKFWVVNNDQQEFSVKVYVEGEMAEYITLNTKELHFRNDDDAFPVSFSINLPTELPPGTSTANIIVEEELLSTDPNVVSSKIILKHKIIVEGPYPDKYIKNKLNFHENGDKIEFVSEVENLGKEDIKKLHTKFYVNDKQQQAHVLETETTPLKTKENKLLKSTLERDLFELGEFEVSAVTTYDDQKIEMVKNLLVGQPKVEVTYFDKYFTAYKINEYSMDLLNKWNQEIENVYVDVEVKKDNQKIDQFRTKSVDIEGLMTERINDYFDAQDKAPGKYTFDLIVNFWNKYRMEQKTFHGELLTEEDAENLVGRAFGDSGSSFVSTLLWLILILILAGITIFVVWRYKQRDSDQ